MYKRQAAYLEIFLLAGAPRFDVAALHLQIRQVPGAASVSYTHLDVYKRQGQYLAGGMTWKDVAANTWAELELNGWREVYEGGVTEWVPGGRYYLTGQPTVDGLSASFKAQDALSGLDGTYYKGVYAPAGRTLYQLALDVLEDSGLAPFSGAAPPWKLWEGLADFMTTAPLPAKDVYKRQAADLLDAYLEENSEASVQNLYVALLTEINERGFFGRKMTKERLKACLLYTSAMAHAVMRL